MEEVVIMPELTDKLNEIIRLLYVKEYFGFLDSAFEYGDKIYDFIYTIPSRKAKSTKDSKYGEYYCSYKPNQNTTWYLIFDKEDNRYLIRDITNNHSPDYDRFISQITG